MGVTVRKPLIARIYWPGKKELAYNDVFIDGEAGSVVTTYEGNHFVETGAFVRSALVGRGHEWDDQNRFNNAWDARSSHAMELDGELIGWLTALGLGSVSSAASGAGYLHTCKPVPIATLTQPPSATIVQKQTDEALYLKYSGICIDEFTISGKRGTGADSWLQASWTEIGSGAVVDGSGVSTPSTTVTTPIKFSEVSVATIGAAGAINVIDRLVDFTFKHGNNLQADKGYLAGSSASASPASIVDAAPVRQRLEYGDRRGSTTLEITFERTRSASTERTNFRAGTSWAIVLTCPGKLISGSTYETWKLTIPVAKVDTYEPDWDDQSGTSKVLLVPDYDSGTAAPFKIEVTNARSALLVAAA